MSKLVFINSVLTITLHSGEHLEFPVPIPQFFQGPKAMTPALPQGNFEVPLAAEEGKEQQVLKGTAAEIVIALTKGYNPACLTKEGKLDGKAYSEQLAKLQSILAGKATKDEAETNIVLNNAALISTIERALNPELDEKISSIEDASEDANPYTVAIEAITDALLMEEVPSPEAAPEEVKAEAENAPEPVVAETTPAIEEPATANLPAVQNQSGGVVIYPENVLTATKAVLAGGAKRRAAQKNILAALQNLNDAEEADEIAISALTGSVLSATTETASK